MLTYNSGFKVTTADTPSFAELFHVLPARVDSQLGSEDIPLTKTAYWLLHPNKYSSPALTATAKAITESKYDASNEATAQQWFILTADELETLTTSIEEAPKATPSTHCTDIYDLQGRKVNTATLRHGIYIVNGRKVVK